MVDKLDTGTPGGDNLLRGTQASIRQWVGRQGPTLRRMAPPVVLTGLVAAALLPVLGAGSMAAVPGALKLVLGQMGQSAILELIKARLQDPIQRAAQPWQRQDALAQDLLARLEAGGAQAAALRVEMSRLLQAVHGVETALATAPDQERDALMDSFQRLGSRFSEFGWMLDEIRHTLAELQERQAEQLLLQRQQLDLHREELAKLNLLLRGQQVSVAVEQTTVATGTVEEEQLPPAPGECPYMGLAAFQPEDSQFFFGRNRLVSQIVARLAETRFLAIVGPSGSGKSSVLGAGLLPAIWEGAVPGGSSWRTLRLTPGPRPLEAVAVAVSTLGSTAPGALLRELEQDPRALRLALAQASIGQPDDLRVLLILDQFEEVFTLCSNEEERRRFIQALLEVVTEDDRRTSVVVGFRADFYSRCTAHPGFAAALQDNQALVGPMSEDEFRKAIEGPAVRAGLALEAGLVDVILRDIGDEPGALPLLSHVLLETWKRRNGHALTLAGYRAAGGAQAAIAQTAERAFDELAGDEQVIARSIFLRLTALGEGTEDTRRRARRDELASGRAASATVDAVLNKLAASRLVMAGDDSVEVAHEALVRNWPRLRAWLDQDREGLRIHRHVTEAAEEWVRLGRDPEALYRGARLAAAREWAAQHDDELNDLEREFLTASRGWQERELEEVRRRNRRLRVLTAGLCVLVAVALALALLARGQTVQAQAAKATAQAQANLASSRGLAAQAGIKLDDQPGVALLDSLQALRTADTVEARSSLLAGLQQHPHLTTFLPTAATVWDVALSPDGHTLAAAGGDNTITLWDTQTHQRVGNPLTGHSDQVQAVAYSPDGRTLASGGWDGAVILWDVSTGRQLGDPLTNDAGSVLSVAFSPDGRTLASAMDETVVLWDVASRARIGRPFTGHTALVRHVAFSPDGRSIASAGDDKRIILWDARSRRRIGRPLTGHLNVVMESVFSPDGRTLASASTDRTIILWDVRSRRRIGNPLSGHTDSVFALALSRDGRTLASAGADRTVMLWDMRSRRRIGRPLTGHSGDIYGMRFSPDGRTLASASTDKTIILWDTRRGHRLGTTLAGHNGAVNSVAYSRDGKLLASGSSDSTVRLWDAHTGKQLGDPLTGHKSSVFAVAISPDGKLLASAGDDNTVILWDTKTRKQLGDPLTGHSKAILNLTFSPDGRTLASASRDRTIILWDVQGRRQLGDALEGHEDDVWSLAFSPDGRMLATASNDQKVLFWDVQSRQRQEPLEVPFLVYALAFSPDGRTLAVAGLSKSVFLWDVQRRRPLEESLTGGGNEVYGLAYSLDGRLLASGGKDQSINLWEVGGRQRLGRSLSDRSGTVWSLAFSPDGRTLASGSDKSLILWTIDPRAWRREACGIVGPLARAGSEAFLPGPEYRDVCTGA